MISNFQVLFCCGIHVQFTVSRSQRVWSPFGTSWHIEYGYNWSSKIATVDLHRLVFLRMKFLKRTEILGVMLKQKFSNSTHLFLFPFLPVLIALDFVSGGFLCHHSTSHYIDIIRFCCLKRITTTLFTVKLVIRGKIIVICIVSEWTNQSKKIVLFLNANLFSRNNQTLLLQQESSFYPRVWSH